MATLAQARIRDDAQQVRWVLFVDGIPYAWTTDTGQGGDGSVRGSGASSWIGLSEDAIGGVEVVGARTVLGGLEMPGTIRESLDVKAGMPEPNPVTFRIHDLDGTLGPLFAREGKDSDVLRERIAPGTTATAATALGSGGTTIDLWGRYVGLERLGPAGERRLFPALPNALVGFDHAVHQNGVLPGELPPVLVSDEPIAWAGRMVTLYAIYRNPDSTASTAAAWPTWDLQDAAGNRAWVGVVRGVVRQRGRVYELECHGRDALMRRQLGTVTTSSWSTISADLNYGEDSIAILFVENLATGAAGTYFHGSLFDRTLTAVDQTTLIAEIHGFIQDVIDGTSTNYVGAEGQLDAWAVAAVPQDAEAGIDSTGIYLAKNEVASNQSFLELQLALPSRVWRQLGYEPETQNFDNNAEPTSDSRQIRFRKLSNGEEFGKPTPLPAHPVPGSTYWVGHFSTVAIGACEQIQDSNEWDNDESRRYWRPKFAGEPYTIDMLGAGQVIRLGGGVVPYFEGQLTVPISGGDVDGNPATRSRLFAMRGKVLIATEGSGGAKIYDGDPVETTQVAQLEWAEDGYGGVSVGDTGFAPALRVVRWYDPRLFGFNSEPLRDLDYWTGLAGDLGDDGVIMLAPLSSYAWWGDAPEWAHTLLSQLWLSTGTGSGYGGVTITAGDNAEVTADGTLFWGDDLELADLGLGIPVQLVASLQSIKDAFDTVPGGWSGSMNRVRMAYLGPYLAQDMVSSLVRSRRLLVSYHGDRFGVVKLASFSPSEADVSILERDLYPTSDDPTSLMPDQQPAPVGHLDAVKLGYRFVPGEGKTALEHTERALDADAIRRTGELEETIEDHGLLPWPWGLAVADVGVPAWYGDFRKLWAFEAAEFYGRSNFSATFNVSRPKGQDLRIGTRVLVTNPWLVDSAGSYGIANHVGIVTATDLDPLTHARRAEVFIFAGQAEGLPFFAPCARVLDQVDETLTLDLDQHDHGNADLTDGDGFTEPSWSTVGGNAIVRILYRVGSTYSLGGTHTVSSYDRVTGELRLTTTPDTTLMYTDRWVLFAGYDSQTANQFVRVLFGVLCLDTLAHGAGPTPGKPFV